CRASGFSFGVARSPERAWHSGRDIYHQRNRRGGTYSCFPRLTGQTIVHVSSGDFRGSSHQFDECDAKGSNFSVGPIDHSSLCSHRTTVWYSLRRQNDCPPLLPRLGHVHMVKTTKLAHVYFRYLWFCWGVAAPLTGSVGCTISATKKSTRVQSNHTRLLVFGHWPPGGTSTLTSVVACGR
ncbi:unnamed protein product, partial [Ectocarpus sp. 4 AP-2014]